MNKIILCINICMIKPFNVFDILTYYLFIIYSSIIKIINLYLKLICIINFEFIKWAYTIIMKINFSNNMKVNH